MLLRRLRLRPSTRAGRWSAVCLGACAFAFLLMNIAVASGQRGGETLSDNWWLAGPALVAFVSAIAGLLTGSFAILRRGERSAPVGLAVLIGVVPLTFVAGEVVAPH
jgi:hypothetical protein